MSWVRSLVMVATAPVILAAAIGCIDGGSDKGGEECEEDLSDVPSADTTESGYGCVAVCTICTEELVNGMTARGDIESSDGDPASAKIKAPCPDRAGGDDYQVSSGSTTGSWAYTSGTHSIDCNAEGDAKGEWKVYLPEFTGGTCADYGEVSCSLIYNLVESGSSTADSPRPACVPGSGTFRLFHQRLHDEDGDFEGWSRLVPLEQTGADFPERAWLRSATVTQWRDMDELRLLKHGFLLNTVGDDIQPAGTLLLNPANPSIELPPNQVTMGALFASEGLSFLGSMMAPTVNLSWSCEQAPPPNPLHYVDLNPPVAYGKRVKELPGLGYSQIQHRALVRVDAAEKIATVELQGRHADRLRVPLVEGANGGWDFVYDTDWIEVDAAGTISLSPTAATITFTSLQIDGMNLGPQTWVLPKFVE